MPDDACSFRKMLLIDFPFQADMCFPSQHRKTHEGGVQQPAFQNPARTATR